MTRGLYPPDTLSANDISTLQTLRRDIYSNAVQGGLFGMGSGLVLHTTAQWANKLRLTKTNLNRNTLMLSVLGSGALGMFLFATTTGKQEVYKLHPIFQVGAMPKDDVDYPTKLQQLHATEGSASNCNASGEETLNMDKLRNVRAVRRQSMMDKLQKGTGISDAHGGHWFQEDKFDTGATVDIDRIREIRTVRRRTLKNSLENGHGLSDSHGGRWSN